jgi:ATP-binding cassette subfamily C protein
MGMSARSQARWTEINRDFVAAHSQASDVSGGLGAISKVIRMMLQSAVLAVGAYLVIEQEATGGIIIASSILTSRALAPVELAVGNWKNFVQARQSWRRLSALFSALPPEPEPLTLPRPTRSLTVENVSITPPGGTRLVASEISFRLQAGQGLGIVGPSGSGKSSLARALVGVWRPVRGKVRLDGAALEQWSSETLGRHIGYLPQDVELFAGSVRDNIARFDEGASDAAVVEAARAGNVHELILELPDGYETEIGEGGQALSAGQRQRIGLARALFGHPMLVVLDEPNSNLDADGEAALTEAVREIRARGGIVVVIAHRPSALAAIDTVLVIAHGQMQAFGPKDDVLRHVLQPIQAHPSEPRLVGQRAVAV